MAGKPPLYAKDEYFGESSLDVFSGRMQIIGTLLYGQSAFVGYFNPPRYRAFRFTAVKDDIVDVWVRSGDGDAVAWVLDTNFQTLGWNDDANAATSDAHIRLVIPTSEPIFYIVFREYRFAFSHFEVYLKWRGRSRGTP